MHKDNVTTLSIKELLDNKAQYTIPVYQRNYAWGEREITQLIQDIIDYLPKKNALPKSYYLGTLIVYERDVNGELIFETIDGQQRLTTLSILTSVIKNEYQHIPLPWFSTLNLDFDSRKSSSETLKAVYNGYFQPNKEYNLSIKDAYDLTIKLLKIKVEESKTAIEDFVAFLYDNVKILRVPVPYDTDLNHYFEIMNNRGEQLEKHEILKAKFLDIFNELPQKEVAKSSECFNLIWEACSNMEKYVQYGFTVAQRDLLFGKNNWNEIQASNFTEIVELFYNDDVNLNDVDSLNIDEILNCKKIHTTYSEKDDNPDRFNSVINFPNFLLHVLRVVTKKDIPLDDKRLISTFMDEIENSENRIEFANNFAFNVLKMKFLFDKYIIKREFIAGTDRWSLKHLKWYPDNKVSYVNTFGDDSNGDELSENRSILMLLAMFHVSSPTLVYKHWLNAALKILFYSKEILPNDYFNELDAIARDFVFGRFIAKTTKEYYTIIYGNIDREYDWDDIDENKLTFGQISNNLVFNYLDFLLWYYNKEIDSTIQKFEFTPRSSVEHYYPQHPQPGFKNLDKKQLNSFGNLCLISHSKNSRLSNLMPTAKKDYYAQNNIDSIKQYKMMKFDSESWDEVSISMHNEEMMQLLKKEVKKHE